MTYTRLTNLNDSDIDYLDCIHSLAEIARYISIDTDRFWDYVTSTENVYYYKVYDGVKFVGALHIEFAEDILYLSVLVFPEYQNKGYGSIIISDVQKDIFSLNYKKIEASVDDANTPSIKLFTKMGFSEFDREEELINFAWIKS